MAKTKPQHCPEPTLAEKVSELADPIIAHADIGVSDTERCLMLALISARLLFAASDEPGELFKQIAREFRFLVAGELCH